MSVALVPDATTAEMYGELLRREGIVCLLQPQGPGYGGWGSAAGLPHRVIVTENLLETAHGLLREHFGDEYLTTLQSGGPHRADLPERGAPHP